MYFVYITYMCIKLVEENHNCKEYGLNLPGFLSSSFHLLFYNTVPPMPTPLNPKRVTLAT